MRFSISQASRQGGRKYNQDRVAYSYSKDSLFMVIADGMGGHFHGEVAAQITVQLMAESFQRRARPVLRDPDSFLLEAMHSTHEAIGDYAIKHELEDMPRTTCVACVIQRNNVHWAHVGDSRLYFFRNGTVLARTRDHSKVQQLFDLGRITEAEMTTHPERNKIYSCLGGLIPPEIEIAPKVPIFDGDKILMCTDGLWGMLSPEEIASILENYSINQAINELLDHAEFRGGPECDNLSAIGMTWGDAGIVGTSSIATATMPFDTFTTEMETLLGGRAGSGEAISDEEIEKAIAEIQSAIKKYSN